MIDETDCEEPDISAARLSYSDVVRADTHPLKHGQHQKDDVVFGRGFSTNIRSVGKPSKHSTATKQNQRRITGVFLTRLAPKTSAAQVALHVRKETGLTVRPEKLETKYNTYSSFYIPGDQRCRDELFCKDLWPMGSLLKPFYS